MIKKLFSFMLLCLCSFIVFAQSGVNFEHLTFDEALAKAKTEKKLVFVDCYTTWCGPCKHMTNEIFPQEKAGEFFNPRFVCVKFDMEAGEGKELKTKFGVKAFPSFYVIRPDGVIQHCVVGGGDLEPFIERIKRGLNEKTSLYYLTQQYNKGKMSKKQLMAYYTVLTDAYDKKNAEKIKNELMAQLTEKDKLKTEFWPVFEDPSCKVGTPDFNLILANLPVFEKNVGKETLEEYLYKSYEKALTPYIAGRKNKDAVSLDELKKQIDGLNIPQKEDLVFQYVLAKAVTDNDSEKIVSLAEEKASTLAGNELWTVLSALRNVENKAYYNRIVAMGEKVLANPENDKMKDYLESTFEHYKKMAHTGVYFEDLTFEQALQKAQKQRKMIFMDGYTSWCGPCKYMSNTIFPQEKVGDFLNRFICVKYDMEKGEGPELAKKLGVRAYPTFVIINSDGSVRHKFVGGGDADEFIARVKEAYDDEKATGVLETKYKEGNRDKGFLKTYIHSLNSVYSPEAPKVAEELFALLTDEEKTSEEYWFLLKQNDLLPDGNHFILTHREQLNQTIGKERVDNQLAGVYKQKISMILADRDNLQTIESLEQMKKDIVGLRLSDEKVLLGQLNIAKAFLSRNADRLITACAKEVNQIPAHEFPVMLAYKAKATATPQQMSRWIKICREVMQNCKDEYFVSRLEGLVKELETR